MEAVLSLMGLKADAVGENDNLAALGIDSMQLMEVCIFAACSPHVSGLTLLKNTLVASILHPCLCFPLKAFTTRTNRP